MTQRAQFTAETSRDGGFVRQPNRFTDRITRNGSTDWPVETGRYRLVVSLACPWAHRSLIVRGLLGLSDAISLAVVDPIRDDRGWHFAPPTTEGAAHREYGGAAPVVADTDIAADPVLGIEFLSQAYTASDPAFTGRVTVPCIVDVASGRVVTNDYPQITLDFSTEWVDYHRPDAPQLYPSELREEIDHVNGLVYADVNNGVYRCGFAASQRSYAEAYDRLFSRLDWLSERLRDQRYLVGDRITEADVRLFTTLVRFDAVYHGHFKCNRQKLSEMPVLWAYARDLYQTPGFGDTVNFDHIKRHYYVTHDAINPTRIVPEGPDPAGWLTPHGREGL